MTYDYLEMSAEIIDRLEAFRQACEQIQDLDNDGCVYCPFYRDDATPRCTLKFIPIDELGLTIGSAQQRLEGEELDFIAEWIKSMPRKPEDNLKDLERRFNK